MFHRFVMTTVLLAPLEACSDGCRNEIVARADAPGGALSAVLFRRDCGATTGLSTQVSILPGGEAPAGRGNVFIADSGHGTPRRSGWGGPWAQARWLGAGHLEVRYAPGSRIFLKREAVPGVRISYRPANE
ncbi:MAG: hypothetical protein IIZ38_02120 [Sphingomonas sp.]|uniref:hypothetical protein n=1 Tax=Sphingomonas sp. TaxID=28214 RepID=UPI0025D3358F|nr:hypothetical protein [Sphingomonas sp.]MBQ1497088.1 hypothetical protein [Sphingomonas sp.]